MARTTSPAVVSSTSEHGADTEDEPRLVLHSGTSNLPIVMTIVAVITLVLICQVLYRMWRDGTDQEGVALFVGVLLLMISVLAYLQRKARWLEAGPSGLTISERGRTRVVPWRDVRVIDDLGYWFAGPPAKRYYLELRDGDSFTFLGDPPQMRRLAGLREGWTSRSVEEGRDSRRSIES